MTKRRQRNYDPTRTEHTPLNVQRSAWRAMGDGIPMPGRPDQVIPRYERNVHDGRLRAFAADEPVIGWHMSISFVNHRGEASRYPTWDEIMNARMVLLPADITFVIRFPADTEGYVAAHLTTFHLHEELHRGDGPPADLLVAAIDAHDLLVTIAADDDVPHYRRNEARTAAAAFDKALGA